MIVWRFFLLMSLMCVSVIVNPAMASEGLQRIVSLSPAMTAMLYELDQERRLVGATRYCRHESESSKKWVVVGGAAAPEVESILALQPDMVIASSLLPENIEKRFQALKIPVQRFRQDRLEDILEQVSWLGKNTGSSAVAEEKLRMVQQILQSPEPTARGTAILVFSHTMEMVAGGKTYPDEVMESAGLENVAASLGQAWPTVSHEWLLKRDPAWILVASEKPDSETDAYKRALLEMWRKHPVLKQLSAIRAGHVIVIPDSQLMIPSLQVFAAIGFLRKEVLRLTEITEGKDAHP